MERGLNELLRKIERLKIRKIVNIAKMKRIPKKIKVYMD